MSCKAQQLLFTAHLWSSAHEQLKTSLKCVSPTSPYPDEFFLSRKMNEVDFVKGTTLELPFFQTIAEHWLFLTPKAADRFCVFWVSLPCG